MLFEMLAMMHSNLEISSQLVPVIEKGCRDWLTRNIQEEARNAERARLAAEQRKRRIERQ